MGHGYEMKLTAIGLRLYTITDDGVLVEEIGIAADEAAAELVVRSWNWCVDKRRRSPE